MKSKNFIFVFFRRLRRAYGCESGCNILNAAGWKGKKRKNGKYVFISAEDALPEKMKQESFSKKLIIFRLYVTFLFICNLIYQVFYEDNKILKRPILAFYWAVTVFVAFGILISTIAP